MISKYNIEFFLKDAEFIQWVNNPDADSSSFWHLFSERNPECRKEMLKAAELIHALKIKRDYPDDILKQDILNNIIARIGTSELNKSRYNGGRSRVVHSLLKYAAVLLVVFVTVYSINQLSNSDNNVVQSNITKPFIKEAPLGTKIQTKLPDGSSVWVNSGSRIEYSKDTAEDTRNIILHGEAFFDIVKNPAQPFVVKTKDISVMVLGTAFNICAYEEKTSMEVALLTGKVFISRLNSSSGIALLPGEKAVINNIEEEIAKLSINYLQDIGWKDGILAFERANFELVKEKLERWYGVRIFVSDEKEFKDWEVDGHFENKSLEMVLKHLSYTKEFNFRIVEKEVYLTKEN